MSERIVQIIADAGHIDKVCDCLDEVSPHRWWRLPKDNDSGRQMVFVSLHQADSQDVIDAISEALDGVDGWRMFSTQVEAALPELDDEDEQERLARKETVNTREEIYADIRQGTALTADYLIMTAIATCVAAIGLSSGQVAVVIGAMVIAPLLGPVLAFAFGSAVGNIPLLWVSLRALGAGLLVAGLVGGALGMVLTGNPDTSMMDFSGALSLRTVALPLASGAAAALMVAGGQTHALVGVMVAAALLPPLAAFGLLLGGGDISGAMRALATVTTNIVSINLAAQVVFLVKGIQPRRWLGEDHVSSVRVTVGASAALVLLMAGGLWAAGRGYTFGL